METNESNADFSKVNKISTVVNVVINILFLSFLIRYIGAFKEIFASMQVAVPMVTQFFLEGKIVLIGASIVMLVSSILLMLVKPNSSQIFFMNTIFIGTVILLTYVGILSMVEPLIGLMEELK